MRSKLLLFAAAILLTTQLHVAAQDPAAAPASDLIARLGDNLVVLDGDKQVKFDASKLAGVKYIAFYYSAEWCPPCRMFSPKLVEFYNRFKPGHPNFELVFVSNDRDEKAMLHYMGTDKMPWPAVKFSQIESKQLNIQHYCGPGIPCLVLVNATTGEVLSDSFKGEDYLGPQHVVDDIQSMVKS